MKNIFRVEPDYSGITLVEVRKEMPTKPLLFVNADMKNKVICFKRQSNPDSEVSLCKGIIPFNQIKRFIDRFSDTDKEIINNILMCS